MTDWEKRAQAIFAEPDAWSTPVLIDKALQLGREMVAEALKSDRRHDAFTLACMDLCRNAAAKAADARAEEIAEKASSLINAQVRASREARQVAATALRDVVCFARSTIEKPDMIPTEPETIFKGVRAARQAEEAAIRADEREKVAKILPDLTHSWPELSGDREQYALLRAAEYLRRKNTPPETREMVLERALRIVHGYAKRGMIVPGHAVNEVSRALEYRPPDP